MHFLSIILLFLLSILATSLEAEIGSGQSAPFQVDTRPGPSAPRDLFLSEETNLDRVVNHSPVFGWAFVPAWNGDGQSAFQCRVETLSSVLIWDSEKVISGSASLRYNGDLNGLQDGQTYRLRVRVWNAANRQSLWAEKTFKMNTAPPMPTAPTPASGTEVVIFRDTHLVSWTLGTDADGDALTVTLRSSLGDIPSQLQETSSLTSGQLLELESGTYVWQVVVSDGYEEIFGPTWTLTADRKGVTGSGQSLPFLVDTRPAVFVSFTFDQHTPKTIEDTGSNGYIGTITGASYSNITPTAEPGTYSLDFRDVGQWIEIRPADGLNFTNDFTIEAYVKILEESEDKWGLIVGRPLSGNTYYLLRIHNRQLYVDLKNQEGNVALQSEREMKVLKWHHVAMVRDTGTKQIRLYLDGIQIGEAEDTTAGTIGENNPTYIGNEPGLGSNLAMRLDDVRLQDQISTPEQLQQRANRIVRVAEMTVSVNSVDFGNAGIGGLGEHAINITNSGEGILIVTFKTTTPFALASKDTAHIVPGTSRNIDLHYQPQSTGQHTGVLTLNSNAPNNATQTIQLKGAGVPEPLLVIKPNPLTFPNTIPVGQQDTATVTISNPGTGPLKISQISISPNVFRTFPDTLYISAKDSAQVSIVCTPTEAGDKLGDLTLKSNAFGTPETTLRVFAVSGLLPVISLSIPDTLIFPDTTGIGDQTPHTFLVQNTGKAPLIIEQITSGNPAFTVLDTAFTVNTSGQQTVRVVFAPTQLGPVSSQLQIKSNDLRASEVTIFVSGIGAQWPIITVQPDTLDFGSITIDSISTHPIVLKNLGEETLRIEKREDILIQDESLFTLEPLTFPVVIPKGFSKNLQITFSPKFVGQQSSILLILNNDPKHTRTQIVLKGAGIKQSVRPEITNLKIAPQRGDRIGSQQPDFSWTAQNQAAWQIQVGSNPGIENSDTWDSEKQAGQTQHVKYEGKTLAWDQVYRVRVRIWDTSDNASEWHAQDFRTLDNHPPIVKIKSPPDLHHEKWDPEETIVFSTQSLRDDDEGGTAIDSLAWVSDLDGVLHTGNLAGDANFEKAVHELTIGTHHITLKAWDNEGDSASVTQTLIVAGQKPIGQIDSLEINGEGRREAILREGVDLLTLFASDDDLDEFGESIVTRTWSLRSESDGYQAVQVLGKEPTLSLGGNALLRGKHRIYYQVIDDEGVGSDADSIDVIVREKYGRAIVVAGGDYELLTTYSGRIASEVYNVLVDKRLFQPEDVIYLNRLSGWKNWWERVEVTDSDVSVSRLKRAILEEAASDNVERGIPLLIFMAGYGGEGVFQLSETELLKGSELGEWLDELNRRKVEIRGLSDVSAIAVEEVVVVVDVCFSRTFLEQISGPGRIVIGSSSRERAVVINGDSFGRFFFRNLSRRSLFESFEEARVQIQSLIDQTPYLDVDGDRIPLFDENGNFVPSEQSNEAIARQIHVGGPVELHLSVEPEIYKARVEDLGQGKFRFEVLADPGLEGLSLSYLVLDNEPVESLPEPGGPATGVFEVVNSGIDTTVYSVEHQFSQDGEFTVLIFGQNDLDGFAGQAQIRVVTREGVVGDLTGDGKVGFPDFLLFAGGFGKKIGDEGWDVRLDLDGNGVVDFSDFIIFAGQFGKPVTSK
jgi:hypothetical protein